MITDTITEEARDQIRQMQDEIERLTKQLVTLKGQLAEYGQHTVHCDHDWPKDPHCTCGFHDAIAALTDD